MILFTCFFIVSFPFQNVRFTRAGPFLSVEMWVMLLPPTVIVLWRIPDLPLPVYFFRKWKLSCVSVWKHVQTQPKPNSTFHRLARQKRVVLCTPRHAYQDKCDLILGLLFELFRCLKPERMWGLNLLLPIYPHTEFIRWDGRQSSEMKEREFQWDNAALIPEVSNSAQPWRFYLHGPINIFLKTILIGNLDKPEKYKVL